MLAGRRVLNIDESSIGQSAFNRKSWGIEGFRNAHDVKTLGHRLSLISAVDTLGQVYFAISQSIVDSSVFSAFLIRLVAVLDAEDPAWRESTVIVLDNATYHSSDETKEVLQALFIPTLFTGPYGYDGSPCEKLFAQFKYGDFNPGSIATGKK